MNSRLSLQLADDCVYGINACILLHNLCIGGDVYQEEYRIQNLVRDEAKITATTHAENKQGDAIIHYVINQ